MQTWLVNGHFDHVVEADDRGLAYGDGLFETIAVRNGVPRFFDRHIARLLDGCRRLNIPDPPAQRIADEITRLIAGVRRGTAKIIITRGIGPRGYRPPAAATPTRAIGFTPDDGDLRRGLPNGIRVISCRTPVSCNAALAGLKTLNRLDNVLARSEWQDDGVSEGLMCDSGGRLIGGTMSNLFMVRDGRLLTPALDRCGIHGIMRAVVMESAARIGLAAEATEIGALDLEQADELFLTNALIGLWPIASCSGRALDIGPVTGAIAADLAARGVEECNT